MQLMFSFSQHLLNQLLYKHLEAYALLVYIQASKSDSFIREQPSSRNYIARISSS